MHLLSKIESIELQSLISSTLISSTIFYSLYYTYSTSTQTLSKEPMDTGQETIISKVLSDEP